MFRLKMEHTIMGAETKNDKFRRLAMARGNRVLRDIELLGNLSNKNNYEYAPDQIRIIFSHPADEVRIAGQRFDGGAKAKREIVL